MKNYATIYADVNDSSALEQRVFLVQESTKGVAAIPTSTDFLYTLSGGGVKFTQPIISSPHRSGRHNNNTIVEKKMTEWSFSTFFNIDKNAANGAAAIDTPVKLLFKSLLGSETGTTTKVYAPTSTPSYYFSIYEVGDKWSKQAVGGWVDMGSMDFPGNGQAKCQWTGHAFHSILVGIGKSTSTNAGTNAIILQTGEGQRFAVGAQVQIIQTNGTSRSADTVAGTARTVTAISGDTITLSGAVLTTASDGTLGAPVYVSYYEPATVTGIDNPLIGLEGTFTSDRLPVGYCLRSLKVDVTNNHELVNYCFGHDGIEGFVPGGRLEVKIDAEFNLSSKLVEFYNGVQKFLPNAFTQVLGPVGGRRLQIDLPRIIFQIPEVSIPENGSVPVKFAGIAYQTQLDAADEIQISFL